MGPTTGRSLFLVTSAVLLLSTTAASAFNITLLLGRYPGFEQFNSLLSRTQLAPMVNSRSTVTVLGLPNDRFSTLTQMTEEDQRRIISLHILLDYYDMPKLNKIPSGTKAGPITTLFQSSGVAGDMQGFVDIIHRRDGTITFGSSVQGAPFVTNLVASVAAQPYNISVLSVSQPIIAPGMDGFWGGGDTGVAQPPPTVAAPAPAAKPSPPPASPVAEEPVADEPTAPSSAPSPSPSRAPSPSPAADAPEAEEEEESPADQTPVTKKNAAAKEVVSGVMFGLVIGLASFVAVH